MAGLASKYCGSALGAIEVWNEENLITEWHGKPISAPLYMDMLKTAYPRIKAACPASSSSLARDSDGCNH